MWKFCISNMSPGESFASVSGTVFWESLHYRLALGKLYNKEKAIQILGTHLSTQVSEISVYVFWDS